MNIKSQIEIKELSIGYGKGKKRKVVLDSINLSAPTGKTIALVGANGKGKSTLLKTIAGLLTPLSGAIYFDDIETHKINRSEKAKLISYVGTSHEVNKTLKVRDLVALGRFPHTGIFGSLTENDIEMIHRAMVDTKTLHLRDAPVGEISDGECQRVLIARSLAQNTPIILLDEPTAYLDIGNKFEMVELMRRLSRTRNKTIIFSSHDLPTVLGTADYMWLIHKKKIINAIPEELVMTHFLDTIFENSNVIFDLDNNEFKVNTKPSRFVKLSGKPYLCRWTEKALNRFGIGHNSGATKIEISIETLQDSLYWEVKEDSKVSKFDNMETMLDYVIAKSTIDDTMSTAP
ncbi:MAG: ABC transporter ATP-binding protein [Salinivirgaceae bacterium]|nr:ABC transporter ATP-binding protein [Salinivirgaceae bacterium]MDD4746601.1 ABC transporter ATP-binding protein [Salinivirgaceae bacterium]MDY0282017.1 ABC transporter ATP-binding protein [Salinivirgaceae bacterium]